MYPIYGTFDPKMLHSVLVHLGNGILSPAPITNDRKQTWRRLINAHSELLGQLPLTGDRAK